MPPEGMGFEEIKKYALKTEKLGFDLFTITDHFLNMQNPNGKEKCPLECWTTLAGLAAVTARINLAPLVSCSNYRPPTLLAKMSTTIDIISNGRFILGLGAGWLREEFESFIGRFPSAKERLDGLEDTAVICREMFEKGISNYQGKMYSAYHALNMPRPVRGYIPIMIGAQGERRALKIAAKYADIIHITGFPTPNIAEHKIDVIRKFCYEVGRDFKELILGIGVWVMPTENRKWIIRHAERVSKSKGIPKDAALKFARCSSGTKNITSLLKEFHDKGIDLFTLPGLNLEEIEKIAEEVLPAVVSQ